LGGEDEGVGCWEGWRGFVTWSRGDEECEVRKGKIKLPLSDAQVDLEQ
jgi:hypothetical protein